MSAPLYLVVPREPVSYQRYGEKRSSAGKRFRWKPPELEEYQAEVHIRALKAGFRQHRFGTSLRVRALFLVRPMTSGRVKEKGSFGLSANQRDVDNMLKAAIDGLGEFFDDRYIADIRGVKMYVRDPALRGVLIRIDNASLHMAMEMLESSFRDAEEAKPWFKSILTSRCS